MPLFIHDVIRFFKSFRKFSPTVLCNKCGKSITENLDKCVSQTNKNGHTYYYCSENCKESNPFRAK